MADHSSHQDVVDFWFNDLRPAEWFRINQKLDQKIIYRFKDLVDLALQGHLTSWSKDPSSGLALILLLDQFPRHVWRGQAKAFSGDARALSLSIKAEEEGWIQAEPERAKRQFWLMPRLHSEQLDIHTHALPLFERWTDPRTFALAQRYQRIIATHGYFPHRDGAREETYSSN